MQRIQVTNQITMSNYIDAFFLHSCQYASTLFIKKYRNVTLFMGEQASFQSKH
eukprot:m.212216 g.212216  ORF g.212216 m.212216 type:complete len:53 (+) comp15071_c0_seq8:2680-2838(+)